MQTFFVMLGSVLLFVAAPWYYFKKLPQFRYSFPLFIAGLGVTQFGYAAQYADWGSMGRLLPTVGATAVCLSALVMWIEKRRNRKATNERH